MCLTTQDEHEAHRDKITFKFSNYTILSQLTGQAINTDAPRRVPNKMPAVVSQGATAGLPMVASHGFGTEYGKKGAAAFAVFRPGEADLEAYARRFDRYYKSGRIGLSFDQIPAELIAESPHLIDGELYVSDFYGRRFKIAMKTGMSIEYDVVR